MTSTQIADANGVGRKDVYTKVTERIISDLEQGIRPWMKPWSAEHAAGRITKPLRHNGTPYSGINILMLWGEAMAKGYTAPIWMTFMQAKKLGGMFARVSTVLWWFTPTPSARPKPTIKARTSSARFAL